MAKQITIDINGVDYAARILPNEEGWEPAALRAIQRRFGKRASVWGWHAENRQVDRDGNTVRIGYKATVVGKPSRYDRGSYPVLAEARLWVGAC